MIRWLETVRRELERRPLALDAVIALAVLAVSLPPLVDGGDCGCRSVPAWGYLLVAAQCALLLARRRLPFLTALTVGVLTGVYGASSLPDPAVPFAGLVAVYSAAAHATRRLAVVTAICTAAGIGIALLASNGDATVQDWSINYLVFATAWLLGDATRNRREAALELAARAAQLERTRELEAGRAVAEERNRIAREMHDVVAHHVSMMVVQAEAGPVVVHRDPDRAAASFDAISATGRQALTEMRRLLGVLRPDERGRLTPQPEPTGPAAQPDPAGLAPQPDPNRLAPLAPQPGASDVPAAVAAMRASGLDVDLAETGRVRPLPPTVDLAAYRIVQEALTNVLKHAGPARAVVRVDYGEDAVTVEVTNDGAGGSKPRSLDGHGLIGMRERAGLVGGDLQAGPAPDGGWRVHARLPLLPVPST